MRLFTLTDQWFLKRYTSLFKGRSVFILYSGGFDSRVLLELLTRNFKKIDGYNIYTIHINHGVNYYSDYWEKLCILTCNYLKIPVIVIRNTIAISYVCSENFCRTLRGIVINSVLPINSVVVTAHHSGDCIETLLQRLCRGVGVLGCASTYYKIYGSVFILVRPLLYVSKGSLYIYADYNKVIWAEDQSNSDFLGFSRNFLRLCITPILKKRWFFFTFTVCRFALFVCKERFNILSCIFAAFLFIKDGTKGFNIRKLFSICDYIRFEVIRFFYYVYYDYAITRVLFEFLEKTLCRNIIHNVIIGSFVFIVYHDLVLVRVHDICLTHRFFRFKNTLSTNLYVTDKFTIYKSCFAFSL